LTQRWTCRPFRWLWTKLRGRRFISAEMEQAGIIYRLERYGVRCGRILAFGQTQYSLGQYESFVLVQDRAHEKRLSQWLAEQAIIQWTAQRKKRWKFVREAGILLRQMHQAHCYLPDQPDELLIVENTREEGPGLLLTGAARIRRRRRSSKNLARKNLRILVRTLGLSNLSQTDRMRILLSYLGQSRLTSSGKKLAADLML